MTPTLPGQNLNPAKLKADEPCLHLGSVEIMPSTIAQDLGVWLDSELIMHDIFLFLQSLLALSASWHRLLFCHAAFIETGLL